MPTLVPVLRHTRWMFLLLLGFCWSGAADAHPHVWIDYWVKAIASPQGITKLRFTWRFDKMFSVQQEADFKIVQIGPRETNLLQQKVFANLENYHYYTYLKVDGVEFEPTKVADFTARLHGKQLEYEFTIALPRPGQHVEITLYDEEFFTDIGPPQGPPAVTGGSMMASAVPQYKEFVSSTGEDGAIAPRCQAQQGVPRVSKMWGTFSLFVVTCQALH